MGISDIPGPHRTVPQNQQQRVALQGRLLTGGSATLIVIRDPGTNEWVVYLEADPERAIRIAQGEIAGAAGRWHEWKMDGIA